MYLNYMSNKNESGNEEELSEYEIENIVDKTIKKG